MCFEKAVAVDPHFATAIGNLGVVRLKLWDLDGAEELFRRVLALAPDLPEAHNYLGKVLCLKGAYEESIASFRRTAALRPDSPEAYHNLGVAFATCGRQQEAVAAYNQALSLKADYPEALNDLGNILMEQGRLVEARTCLERALEIKPSLTAVMNNLGLVLCRLDRLDEAAAVYRRLLSLQSDFPEALSNLGKVLRLQDKLEESIACLEQTLILRPDFPEALANLASSLNDLRRLSEAIPLLERAVALKSNSGEMHLNLGMMLLAVGRFEEGWREFEWRWQTPEQAPLRNTYTQPLWRGEAAEGSTLLLWSEQGFGDTIQFCRYAPLAAARGLRVVLMVQPALVRLLGSLDGVDAIVGMGSAVPDHDFQCPLLSLPAAFGTELDSIPADVPYLSAEGNAVLAWRQKLPAVPPGSIKVGLVWAGNAGLDHIDSTVRDRRRSIAPQVLAPLLEIEGVRFYSLQKGGAPAPAEFGLIDFMGDCRDFADTAALVANLDLVVSVDTAVVHLAGAIGKPVWVMNRFDSCWRWFVDREDNPWYPALRLFNQSRPGDWEGVVAPRAGCTGKTSKHSLTPVYFRRRWRGENIASFSSMLLEIIHESQAIQRCHFHAVRFGYCQP